VEIQRDLEMVAASNPGEEPSDNDGHGNNGDSTSKSPKNQDAMDTDSTLNLQDQEGANQSSTGGPDINKLAGEFSSVVKFSPKVKLMMEQSRLEISAFIASLSASAAAAEKPVETTAVTPPAPVVAPDVSAAATAPEAASSAAAQSVDLCCTARVAEAPAAGAEISLVEAAAPPTAAVEFGSADDAAGHSAAATISATDAQIDIGHVFDINAKAIIAAASRAPSLISAALTPISGSGTPVPAPPAADAVFAAAGIPTAGSQKGSFRNSSKSAREVLRGPKTNCDASHSTAETSQLPPGERTVGGGHMEDSAPTPPQCEKRAPLVSTSPRIAAAPFSPSTPSRKLADVIAFGGIGEEMTSPICSSQRVRMQPNGDATQMERATQLAEKRFHVLSPGTKPKLAFSKFSDHEIAARATTLGVSLGSNISDIEQSIASLKQVEEDRRVTYLQNNLNESLGIETECEIMSTANQLCSDLELEDRVAPMGDSSDPVLSMPIKSLLKRTKKNAANLGVSVRRSTRIKKYKTNLK
jgi:hypothetical protein